MAEAPRSQIPLNRPIANAQGLVGQDWAFWFNSLVAGLPVGGTGFVIDGSASSYAPMQIFQGPAAKRGSDPEPGSIYFATDTGDIYVAQGSTWELQSGVLVGDVTKEAGSNVTHLAKVNSHFGTYGDTHNVPIITVNDKGLVTSITTVPVTAAPAPAAGPPGAIQFNSYGSPGGVPSFTFDPVQNKLYVQNIQVGGQITFANAGATFNNLSPLTTKGDLLGHTTTTNLRLPVGIDGQVLHVDSASAAGISWRDIHEEHTLITAIIGGTF
jgi:hypothetical protein